MALENPTYIADLVPTNPDGSDSRTTSDDHHRIQKKAAKNTICGFLGGLAVTGTDGGAVNAYTVTPTTNALPSYTARLSVVFSPSVTNTGASTINVSGLGAKDIKRIDGSALVAGDLVSGSIYVAIYNGTEFRLMAPTKQYIDQLAFSSVLPNQAGNSGKALFTDGTNASWDELVINGAFRSKQVFTASGTYTKPAGLKRVRVTVVGGGGGGAGQLSAAGSFPITSGGGAGGHAIKYIEAADIAATEAVTVGAAGAGGVGTATAATAGGTSSFGAHCSATGGSPGGTSSQSNGGAGGVGTGGTINGAGGRGGPATRSGEGGASIFGAGGAAVYSSANGFSAENYGAGGGAAADSANVAKTGGNGYAGIVIVEEFF